MKKLLSLLTILILSSQLTYAASVGGTSTASIAQTLTITEIQGANFGTIVTNGYSGVVVLFFYEGDVLCGEYGEQNFTWLSGCVVPAFKVTGESGQNVYLSSSVAGSGVSLIGPSGSEPIIFDFVSIFGSDVAADGDETFDVNGEAIVYPRVYIIINENQMSGVYTGVYPITVHY